MSIIYREEIKNAGASPMLGSFDLKVYAHDREYTYPSVMVSVGFGSAQTTMHLSVESARHFGEGLLKAVEAIKSLPEY